MSDEGARSRESYKEEIKVLKMDNEALRADNDARQKQLDTFLEQIKSLKESITAIRASWKYDLSIVESMVKERNKLKDKLESYERDFKLRKSENMQLRDKLAKIEERITIAWKLKTEGLEYDETPDDLAQSLINYIQTGDTKLLNLTDKGKEIL